MNTVHFLLCNSQWNASSNFCSTETELLVNWWAGEVSWKHVFTQNYSTYGWWSPMFCLSYQDVRVIKIFKYLKFELSLLALLLSNLIGMIENLIYWSLTVVEKSRHFTTGSVETFISFGFPSYFSWFSLNQAPFELYKKPLRLDSKHSSREKGIEEQNI